MNTPSPLRMITLGFVTAFGFAFSSVALAQSPPPAPPNPPTDRPPSVPAVPAASSQLPVLTQSSRVRAFYPGPGGEVRNLYLQNGSVVDLTPTLGGQLGPAVRKGDKITVTGTKSEINGQSLLEATSIRLNNQTFSANTPPSVPGALAEGAVPPQPGAPQAPSPAPSPRRKIKSAGPPPCPASEDAPPPPPDFGGPPPPPPDGMAPPPPPDGMAPPPPPQD
jgi:hypothetical protein